jgi:hypothetical protein
MKCITILKIIKSPTLIVGYVGTCGMVLYVCISCLTLCIWVHDSTHNLKSLLRGRATWCPLPVLSRVWYRPGSQPNWDGRVHMKIRFVKSNFFI